MASCPKHLPCQKVSHLILYCAVHYTTVQYSTIQYSTSQYSTVLCSAVLCSAVQYSTSHILIFTVTLFKPWLCFILNKGYAILLLLSPPSCTHLSILFLRLHSPHLPSSPLLLIFSIFFVISVLPTSGFCHYRLSQWGLQGKTPHHCTVLHCTALYSPCPSFW